MKNKWLAILALLTILPLALTAMDVELPLVQAMAYFPFQDQRTLEKKQWSLDLNSYYSNIYMYESQFKVVQDMELLSLTAAFRYGIAAGITLECYVRLAGSMGGWMDKMIEDFHELTFWPVSGRDTLPRNQVDYKYRDVFDYHSGQRSMNQILLASLLRLWHQGPWQMNGRLGAAIPVVSKTGYVSDQSFGIAGLIFSYQKKHWQISLANHLAFYYRPSWLGPAEVLSKHIFHSELRFDYQKIFWGGQFRSSPYHALEVSHHAIQLYFGMRLLSKVEIALIEELPPMDTTPDVCFNIRIHLCD